MTFTVRRLADDTKKRRPFPWKKLGLGLLKISGPVIAVVEILYKHAQNVREKQEKEREQLNLLKRILVILIAILCATLLFAATAKALVDLKILTLKNLVSIVASDLPTDATGHTNILLLGKGDAGHDGIDLTDTIMIASLDPKKTKSAVLLSVPRDLYLLKTDNMGAGKINTMYRDYKISLIREGKTKEEASKIAMNEVAQELGKVLNIKIQHVIMVDFLGFTQAVDAIGGVDVEVAQDLVDTEYPADESSYTTFEIKAGPQHLDGETALKYARSRHSTSDFDRSRRQQQILKAIGDKVKSGGLLTKPNQITELLNIMKDHVETTLAVRDMLGLAKIASDINRDNLLSIQLNDQNGLYGSIIRPGGLLYTPPRTQFKGASVLLPVSIPENPITWKQIQLLTHLQVDQRLHFVYSLPINVLNAGAKPGSGRKFAGELERFGFTIDQVTNAPDEIKAEGQSFVTGPVGAKEREETSFFANMLHWPQVTNPVGIPVEGSGSQRISIVLGKDYTYTPLQSLLTQQ